MFDLNPLLTGRPYTTVAALLAVAFVFSPAALIVLPSGYVSVCLAIACSAISATLAWMTWTKSSRSLAIAAGARMRIMPVLLLAGLAASTLRAGDFSSYRGMQLGTNLNVSVAQAGAKLSDVRTIHQRPALMQELDWWPRLPASEGPVKADPVKTGLLCFFNGELFRIVITYDRFRIEGMTTEDMIEAISSTYGTAARPEAEVAYHTIYGEVASVLARWDDSQYSYDLVRSGDRSSFALILYSKRLDALAQAALIEAAQLDLQEAPQKLMEMQKKQDDEERLALEKARLLNKPNFRP
jgi:hypothetical protein